MKAIDLHNASCTAYEGDEPSLSHEDAEVLIEQLSSDWQLSVDNKSISCLFRFGDFHKTMDFVDKVAAIVHKEDHHPYMEISYNRCLIRYTTHTLNGLSLNDFICAAKIDDAIK